MPYLIIALILIVLILAVSLWAYLRTFYYQKKEYDIYDLPRGEQYEPYHNKMKELMRSMEAIEGEIVTVRSHDGKKLRATYYHVSDSAPLHIQFHGYHGHYIRDFCGGNKLARDLGHNTLVIEQRAHSSSEGRSISFGINESHDCLAWIKYAIDRFGNKTKIILSGVSMGAATVLMATRFELPENIIGIIADCPYSSPKEIIKKVCGEMRYPPALTFPFIWLGGVIYGHFNIVKTDALRAVKNAKVPILLIHGEGDRFVPCDMSRKIYENCKDIAELYTVKNAGHGMSYMVDTEGYTQKADEFINKILNGTA